MKKIYSKLKKSLGNKKILILGGTGYLGEGFQRILKKFNNQVLIVGNKNIKKKRSKNHFFYKKIDLTNLKKLKTFTKENYDIIFYCATIADSKNQNTKDNQKINFILNNQTLRFFLNLACKKKIKLIYLSSVRVFNHTNKKLFENNKIKYSSLKNPSYVNCKINGEALCKQFMNKFKNNNIHIVRLGHIFGDVGFFSRGRIINDFIIQAINEKKITIIEEINSFKNFSYIDNVILKLIFIGIFGKNFIYHLSGKDLKLINLFNKLKFYIPNIKLFTSNQNSRTGYKFSSRVFEKEFKKIFNYKWEENFVLGLKKTVNFFKKNSNKF
jgi:nucleoside-diphosphate-sugar epimerase